MKQIKLALLIILLAVLCKSSFAGDSTNTCPPQCPQVKIGCNCLYVNLRDQNDSNDLIKYFKIIENDVSRKRISGILDTLISFQTSIYENINSLKSSLLNINSVSVNALQNNSVEYFNQINIYQNEITRLEIIQNRNSAAIEKLQVLLLNYLYKNSDYDTNESIK